jgi:hypothetical protein
MAASGTFSCPANDAAEWPAAHAISSSTILAAPVRIFVKKNPLGQKDPFEFPKPSIVLLYGILNRCPRELL